MPAPSYLSKDRHGGYLFRIKIPTDLIEAFDGTRILVKSLQTHHRPTALKLARRLAVISQEVFDQIKMSEKPLKHQLAFAKAKLSIQRGKLDDIKFGRVTVSEGKVRYTETTQSAQELEELGDENLEIIIDEQSELEQKIVKFKRLVNKLEFQLSHANKIKLQRQAEEMEGITPRNSPEQTVQVAELLSKIEALQHSTTPSTQLTELFHKIEALQNAIDQKNETPDSGLISELWENFRKEKEVDGWTSAKMVNERAGQIRDFIEIIGGDMPASRVDRNIVLKTLTGLASFPTYRATRWKNATSLADIPKSAPIISTDTQAQRIYNLSEFFGYLARRKIIQENPFAEFVKDRDTNNYATPTTKDIKEWFNLPEELIRNAWQFWIPRIALLSGARAAEIAQLKPDNIKQDHDTGIHYILISGQVKSKAAKRRIPLHQDLIDNGFLDYCKLVKTKGLPTLWPGLKAKGNSIAANISEYWANLRDEHNVLSEPVGEHGRRKVFHSLRRVILNKLFSDGIDIITIQAIVGHEPSLGSSIPYIEESKALRLTNDALQRLEVKGVGWEHPKKLSIT